MGNDSACLNLNDELWDFRRDYTTRLPTMAIFSIFYAVIIVCGCIGNTCVILAITRNNNCPVIVLIPFSYLKANIASSCHKLIALAIFQHSLWR
uniref:G_PROTEIN_RECEP_F1_2 domain-containing protein n=1 Tax=Heterorhabditis bacteriophora TaxID=37862 RepID=A0A1I7WPJ8_HETBA